MTQGSRPNRIRIAAWTAALKRRPFWIVALVLLVAIGCSGIGVKPGSMESLVASFEYSFNPEDKPSPRSLQTLRQFDLDGYYHRRPYEAFARLQTLVGEPAPPDLIFTLAELSYQLGQRAERHKHPVALRYYYFSAGYAYHYLFDPLQAKAEQMKLSGRSCQQLPINFFDPRFRLACEIYNASLSKCLRAAQAMGFLDCRQQMHVPGFDGNPFCLSVSHHGFRWQPAEFGPMKFCSDYQVVGLANHHRSFGLGVPLLVERVPTPEGPAAGLYPDGLTFPVTAFFRFEGSLAKLGHQREGKLELYNPLTVQSVTIDGWAIPLETDLTTPIAYFLAQNNLDAIAYLGFSFVERVQQRAGIYLPHPYEPGKIPVVFVHGLLSSPITWAPMVNDLLADPVIRSRYQFWFYLYPTGNPYLVTAADLRARLRLLRQELDPHGSDAAWDQMVVVGHSMGGLVAKLLTVDSGNAFWELASPLPFEEIGLKPETKAELESVFFFNRLKEVKKVIYLATPHQGSELSPGLIGQLGRRLIRLPLKFQEDMQQLITQNPQYRLATTPRMLPTSIDLLAPGNPALETLAQRPLAPGVCYHTVAGIMPRRDCITQLKEALGFPTLCGDGVVPYDSAHAPEASTELVVTSDHMRVHHHPLAIEEVRRLLDAHWRQVMGK